MLTPTVDDQCIFADVGNQCFRPVVRPTRCGRVPSALDGDWSPTEQGDGGVLDYGWSGGPAAPLRGWSGLAVHVHMVAETFWPLLRYRYSKTLGWLLTT